jgi:hypothetical protein
MIMAISSQGFGSSSELHLFRTNENYIVVHTCVPNSEISDLLIALHDLLNI